jgi:hypothetical protein
MTEPPDTAVAALAVQLAALKGNLGHAREDLETTRRELAARIDTLTSQLAAQAGGGLAQEVGPAGEPRPTATCWPNLDADAKTAAMAELAQWVDVMRQWHQSYFAAVADCWAAHPEVVIELHNLMTEYTRIYRTKHPPLADALLLYDRWLPGMLRRCSQVMKDCGPAGCVLKRQLTYKALYQ